ncbi:MAG TPA: transcriptional repressor NrdR [Candidatus Latescibacteria bacterium]|nr:transcriptional repressor NrdR [Candidatus Latescibacterota bacterium]
MRCPKCDATENHVVDTRDSRGGRAVRRRRECAVCGARFTTYEHVEERPLRVAKRDGSGEDFDRTKLLRSVAIACAKRPVTEADIDAVVGAVEENLSRTASFEVSSSLIGEIVMEHLGPLDRVAYVRFASVYRNFQDIGEFQDMVHDLNAEERRQGSARNQEELPL